MALAKSASSSDSEKFVITIPDERIPLIEIYCELQKKLSAVYENLVKAKRERAALTPRLRFCAEIISISDVLISFADLPPFVVLLSSTGALSPPHNGHVHI